MIKKIFLLIIILFLIVAGLFAYFFFKAGTGPGPAGGIETQGIIAPSETLPESNVFKETEINPFEDGYKNPFE